MRSGLRMNLMGALGVALLLSAATAPTLPPDVAEAAMRGDVAAVRALLQQGADVNMAQGDGMTALHWAAERGNAELAEMLLYAGASVRATTRIGDYTPLHLAAKSGSPAIIELMVGADADVNAKTTNSGATAIHFAAASGNAEAVNTLLQAGADANAREGLWEQTPLMFAAALNRAEAIRALVAGGADPNLTSRVPTGLENAAERAGSLKTREMIEAFSGEGRTPTPTQVQAAIDAGRSVTRTVLETGVVPVTEDEGRGGRGGGGGGGDDDEGGPSAAPGGMTALLHAARQGHVAAVEALIEAGADVNVVRGTDMTSPLLISTINAQWDVAMLLIEAGADPNLEEAVAGATPLWTTINSQWPPRTRFPQPQEGWYQQASYLNVLEALLKAGGDPDEPVDDQPFYITYSGCGNGNCGLTQLGGTTPFLRAAHSADVEAMRMLAAYGTNTQAIRVEEPDDDRGGRGGGRGGRGGDEPAGPPVPEVPVGPATAIHFAAGLGFGQGVGAGNANRFKPGGWMPTMRYLVEELGFDVNARDTDGFTPLHFAAARGDIEMIHYLVEKGADVKARSRPDGAFELGYTVADMANGPQDRITPMPAVIELLVSLGSENSNKCQSCE